MKKKLSLGFRKSLVLQNGVCFAWPRRIRKKDPLFATVLRCCLEGFDKEHAGPVWEGGSRNVGVVTWIERTLGA